MPEIYFQPLSRRRFLRATSTALAALSVNAVSVRAASAAGQANSVHLALLSDTHIPADPLNEYRGFRPVENLRAAVPQVLAARPEGVLINGDAARLSGELGDYAALKQLLEPVAAQSPIYVALGNHDHRENFIKTFASPQAAKQSVSGKHVLVLEWPAVRLVLLDSLMQTNQTPGLLGKVQREWLARFLAESDARPTALFVHHTLGDNDGELLDVDRLFALLRPHRKVKAIFFGHSHEYYAARHQGIHLVNLPALGYNFADKEPVGWVDARFDPRGVTLTLRALAGNRADDGKSTSLTWAS